MIDCFKKQRNFDWFTMMQEDDPLCIYLVISGSRGTRLLFKYPFQEKTNHNADGSSKSLAEKPRIAEDLIQHHNPYILKKNDQHKSSPSSNKTPIFENCLLYGFHDEELASLLAPKQIMCNQKFSLSIDLVKLVGYPVLVVPDNECQDYQDLLEIEHSSDDVMINMVHVVLAIPCHTDPKIVVHYQNICMMLGKALRHEEKRYVVNFKL